MFPILSELTSTPSYMQAITNAQKTNTHTDGHIHTLFLIWPIKTCVVNRENLSVVHTNTQQLQCWVCATCMTSNNKRHV